jgi:hypothetical protein
MIGDGQAVKAESFGLLREPNEIVGFDACR